LPIKIALNALTSGVSLSAYSMQDKLREHIEKIVPLSDDEFAFVCSHFTVKKFKKHQFLIQQGEAVKYHYFVVSGLLKLVYTDDTGK
jgi:CRP-like cAMP-binding protein